MNEEIKACLANHPYTFISMKQYFYSLNSKLKFDEWLFHPDER